MNKSITKYITLLSVVLLLGLLVVKKYRSIKMEQNQVRTTFSSVEACYKKKVALVPELVGLMNQDKLHEAENRATLEEIQHSLLEAKMDPELFPDHNIVLYQEKQNKLNDGIGTLLNLLQDTASFRSSQAIVLRLQKEFETIDRDLLEALQEYNRTARAYNLYINRFPQDSFSDVMGFNPEPYLETSGLKVGA